MKQTNINNLTSLWMLMGANVQDIAGIPVYTSTLWPDKVWIDWTYRPTLEELSGLFAQYPQTGRQLIFPAWHYPDLDNISVPNRQVLTVRTRQTAMVLSMPNRQNRAESTQNLTFKIIAQDDDIQTWVGIVSQAFGYEVNPLVIKQIATKQGVTLILAFSGDEPVATSTLYESHGVVGIHQVGVGLNYRKQGIAKQMMNHLLDLIEDKGYQHATLQASAMGAPLYRQLGFEDQFEHPNLGLNFG